MKRSCNDKSLQDRRLPPLGGLEGVLDQGLVLLVREAEVVDQHVVTVGEFRVLEHLQPRLDLEQQQVLCVEAGLDALQIHQRAHK